MHARNWLLVIEMMTPLKRALRCAAVRWRGALLVIPAMVLAGHGFAQAESWAQTKKRILQEDFPFHTTCVSAPFPGTNNTAYKGLALRTGNGASVLFDPDLLRMAAGWTGGFITTRGIALNGENGPHPSIDGEQKFGTPPLPGWTTDTNNFTDPRPEPYGPLPRGWAHWNGLYLVGNRAVLSYSVGGVTVFEEPSSVTNNGAVGFVRTFRIGRMPRPLRLLLCEVGNSSGRVEGLTAFLESSNAATVVALVGSPAGAQLEVESGTRLVARFAETRADTTFKVVLWNGAKSDLLKFAALTNGVPVITEFAKGGPPHWTNVVVTTGVLATNATPDAAFVVDRITPPWDNPWQRRVRFGGFDFFSDTTRAALCTWDGDVWIVSGLDDKLEKLTWRRFASGLHEPLGLKIVNDLIYTVGKDQVTRLHDLNGDGEADFYENFNNDLATAEGPHEYSYDLHTDQEGNFYFCKGGPWRPGGRGFMTITRHAGTVLKLARDGSRLEVLATGLRAPNGMSLGPDGQITTGDNEGTWVPTTPINWIRPGGFYGCVPTAHRQPLPEFCPPLCWLSHNGADNFDNSTGGQVWVPRQAWGPFGGQLLHLSYGKCRLFLVMKEEVNGLMQGGAVRIPLRFTSSAMRGRFNAKNGQLYVCGLGGWQTDTVVEGGFDRVRHTGQPIHSVCGLNVVSNGVRLTFTQPLDRATATDVQNYSVTRWNYRRTETYGSPEFSVSDPAKQGKDTAEVRAASLSADGTIVLLEFADVRPVMQEEINFKLKAADGVEIAQKIQHTIHVVPSGRLTDKPETGSAAEASSHTSPAR